MLKQLLMNDSEERARIATGSLSEAFKDFDYNRKELFSSSYIDIIKELIVKVETLDRTLQRSERAIVELNNCFSNYSESIKTIK